jgi:hypothetical protein
MSYYTIQQWCIVVIIQIPYHCGAIVGGKRGFNIIAFPHNLTDQDVPLVLLLYSKSYGGLTCTTDKGHKAYIQNFGGETPGNKMPGRPKLV